LNMAYPPEQHEDEIEDEIEESNYMMETTPDEE